MVIRKSTASREDYDSLGVFIAEGCPNNRIPDEDDEWADDADDADDSE